MRNRNKSNNESVLLKLEQARKETEKEQDNYRKIIEQSQQNTEDIKLPEKVESNGLNGLCDIMKDYQWPPTHEERRMVLKIEDEESVARKELNTIADEKVRSYMFFLNETVEHTKRLRAMARFSLCVCPLAGAGNQLFNFWSKKSAMELLMEEAQILGISDYEESFLATLNVFDLIIESVLEHWPNGLALGNSD